MRDEHTAWWFAPADRRLGFGDARSVVIGEPIEVDGPIELCVRGLHASVEAVDALAFAPSPLVCRVRLEGLVKHGDGKSVAARRTVLAMGDAMGAVEWWAGWCADRDTINGHVSLPRWSDLDSQRLALRYNDIGLTWRHRRWPLLLMARWVMRRRYMAPQPGLDWEIERQIEADMLTRKLLEVVGG